MARECRPVARQGQPRQARRSAEAIGCNAKTDAVDAAMLARMGALLELPSRPISGETFDAMKELQVARLGLVNDRTAAKNREHVCRSPPRSGLPRSTVRSPRSTPN
ncbi:IS110 family transposase [Glacieibacterium megasporae]|uniref:IS110 family transposase n=1 Tax=Glacieibacterium megasporae TaxID=2835787 RepID=UPI001C1E0744|nr:transposase [Polymorphobacter megasporae]